LIDTQDIFENSAGDIYRFVDSNGVDSVYESLNNLFEESEKIIPTKFNDYKKVSPEDFIKVRSNFYLLWNMAENIKVSFYRDIGFFKIDFSDYKPEIGSLIKKGKYISSFFINVYKNKSFQLHTDLPEAAITKDDVNILIKPDIYNIVKRFMEPLYLEGALHEFNFIKLTGQTCKIDIFRDALKEFIEGRIIQSSQRGKNLRDFKLICLDGAIKYQNAKKIGLIAPSIKNSIPTLPYTITSFTHTGAEITMLSSLDGVETNNGFISRNIDTKYLELLLKNINNKVLHKYIFNIDTNNFAKTSYDEISSKYGDKIIQDNIDNIVNNEIKIFTYTLHDSWGFFVVAICRIDGALFISKDKYLAFENGEWELNFFDGV
jgi:hypothetical protein